MTSGLRQGGCVPFPDRQVTLQHPRVIPSSSPLCHLLLQKKIIFSSHQPLENHSVCGSQCCERLEGSLEGGTGATGGHGAQSQHGSCPAAPTAPLPAPHRLQKHEDLPARAKKTHLPTHTVLTMKTLIIFHSPIKGMIHGGEWARRITQDERRGATARPFGVALPKSGAARSTWGGAG